MADPIALTSELAAWKQAREQLLAAYATAAAGGDFAAVSVRPYADVANATDLPRESAAFPVLSETVAELVDHIRLRGVDNDKVAALIRQIGVGESFKKCLVGRRLRRHELLEGWQRYQTERPGREDTVVNAMLGNAFANRMGLEAT